MGDFRVEGAELKKMIKVAKKGPTAFGFNPGKSEEDAYLAMDRKKQPMVVGKDAKEGGEGGKFAFGTATLAGKILTLTCLRELPGLAKKMKKYLKSQKVMLNVVVLDADGNTLESDIEDGLPDDPDLEGEEEAEATETAGQNPVETAPEAESEDRADLVRRLRDMRDKLATLPPEAAARLSGPFRNVTEQIKAGQIDTATVGLSKLEAAFAMLSRQAAPETGVAPETDPQTSRLTQAVAVLRGKVEQVADPKDRAALLQALKLVQELIEGREIEKALSAIKRIQAALATIGDGAARPTEAAPFVKAGNDWVKARGTMQTEVRRLEAAIISACSGDDRLTPVVQAVGALGGRVESLDGRLADKMTELARAEADDARLRLKTEALDLISEYRAMLATDFFKEVDQSSGFGTFAIASTADATLTDIAHALA